MKRLLRAFAAAGLLLVLASPAAPGAQPAPKVDIAELQKQLFRLNYRPGKADGTTTESTRRAIRNFQRVVGEKPTGEPSAALLTEIQKPCEVYLDDKGYKRVRGGCPKPSLAADNFPDVYLLQVGKHEEAVKIEPLEHDGW
jgi:peptidoglycan hydrolase-like protein with peptidoglycan-binding domain